MNPESEKRSLLKRMRQPLLPGRRSPGFTLIELLAVISIMALLAATLVGVIAIAKKSRNTKLVTAQMQQIVTAIDSYFQEYGSYPPDFVATVSGTEVVNTGTNALFYELTGAVYRPATATFQSSDGEDTFTETQLNNAFGIRGFLNAGDNSDGKNFLNKLEQRQWEEVEVGGVNVRVLTVPVRGPDAYSIPVASGSANPWHYNATNPTNNPGSYDLYAVVLIGDETHIIGNGFAHPLK